MKGNSFRSIFEPIATLSNVMLCSIMLEFEADA